MDAITELQRQILELQARLRAFEAGEFATTETTYLSAPLTSASWDGDGYSTTAKTKIDLSVVFGVPANVKAVLVRMLCRESASAGTNNLFVALSPNNGTTSTFLVRPSGLPNDYFVEGTAWVPCDANGDIYYQISASGAGTMDVWLEIWGYAR